MYVAAVAVQSLVRRQLLLLYSMFRTYHSTVRQLMSPSLLVFGVLFSYGTMTPCDSEPAPASQ